MNQNLNDQFPPVSPNGTGPTHRTKKTQPGNDHPANGAGKQPNPAKTNPTPKATPGNEPKPAQLLRSKVSAYIANYPLQTIGGLLALLLVIVLFKTFYQGKNWKAKRMAEEAYYVANQYARNNSTNLHPYLSQAFRREVRQLPGLLPLSMQTATRGGTIAGAESVGLREITPDSVIVEVALRYENGRDEKLYQPLVYEKDQWRLGLSYSR